MSAAEQPSRFSQAQLLIAALFAVVFTGETTDDVHLGEPDPCPEDHMPTIEPLRVRFADVVLRKKWREWMEWRCNLTPKAADFVLVTRLLPSVVHEAIDSAIEESGMRHTFGGYMAEPHASYRGQIARRLFREVGAKIGLEARLVALCHTEKLTDEAWQRAHDFLTKLDSGELHRDSAIYGLEYGFSDLACDPLGVTPDHLWACLRGYEHDERVRNAARAVIKAMNAAHSGYWSCASDPELILRTLAPFMAAQQEVLL